MSPEGVPPVLARRVPDHISAAAQRIGRFEELRDEAERLGIALPASLERAIEKRRREYLAGRISARRALADLLGADAAEGAIAADVDDVPLWPEGVVGSISHGAGFGFAAVAAASACRGLGVDVERVVSTAQASRLGPRVLNDRELDLRRGDGGGLTEEEMFTLVFSAKESAYKALFPVHRQVLGFRDVELERCKGEEIGGGHAGALRLRAKLDGEVGSAGSLTGWYAVTAGGRDPADADPSRVWTVVIAGSDPVG